MTTRFSTTLIFTLLLFPVLALGNDTTMTCSMFRLKLKDSSATGGTSGRMVGNTFTGLDWDKKTITVGVQEITRIDTSGGSLMLQGAAFGAAVGVFAALALNKRITYQSENTNGNHKLTFARGALFMAGGAVVGAIAGSFFRKWKSIRLPDGYSVGDFQGGPIKFGIAITF